MIKQVSYDVMTYSDQITMVSFVCKYKFVTLVLMS